MTGSLLEMIEVGTVGGLKVTLERLSSDFPKRNRKKIASDAARKERMATRNFILIFS